MNTYRDETRRHRIMQILVNIAQCNRIVCPKITIVDNREKWRKRNDATLPVAPANDTGTE